MRQQQRRTEFQSAFQSMPLWETWITEYPLRVEEPMEKIGSMYAAWIKDCEIERKVRNHCKVIPRRLRRQMARDRLKRERSLSA